MVTEESLSEVAMIDSNSRKNQVPVWSSVSPKRSDHLKIPLNIHQFKKEYLPYKKMKQSFNQNNLVSHKFKVSKGGFVQKNKKDVRQLIDHHDVEKYERQAKDIKR